MGCGVAVDGFARGDARVDFVDLVEILEQRAVGGDFDHVDVLAEDAVVVFAGVADAPDDPELFGAAAHGFQRIGVADPHGVEVEIAVDGNRGHEDGQGDAGDQVIHRHLRVGDHLAGLAGEVAHVEGADGAGAGADFFDVDAEVRKDVIHQAPRVAHGFHALRRSVFRERHQGDELVHVERFPAGDHLVGREAGEQHGEIDGAAGCAVHVVELDAGFGQRLDDAGLVSHAHAAAGQDERTPGSGHERSSRLRGAERCWGSRRASCT